VLEGRAVARTVGLLAAVSLDGVIAQGGRIPWDEPADRRYFKRRTMGGAVIMGRRTWLALPARPLPGRDNFVLTRRPDDAPELTGARAFARLSRAIEAAPGDAWLIGGAEVYREGYDYADVLDITRVPQRIGEEDVVRMPPIPTDQFELAEQLELPDAPHLVLERWVRRGRGA